MISRGATYAVRALVFLADRAVDRWLLSREIAKELSLPPQFLSKILGTLAVEGILMSQRGRAGGFRLARKAEEISLLDVIEPFDHLGSRRHCVLGQGICTDSRPCPIHDKWKAISDNFLQVLQTTSIADLAKHIDPDGFPKRTEASVAMTRDGDG